MVLIHDEFPVMILLFREEEIPYSIKGDFVRISLKQSTSNLRVFSDLRERNLRETMFLEE